MTSISSLQARADLLDTLVRTVQSQVHQLQRQQPGQSQIAINALSSASAKNDTAQKRKPRSIDALGARMKQYEEAAYVSKLLDNSLPLIVRLDGHCFHTFTRGFQRPFDKNLHRAMVLTTGDLVDRFQAYCGYTQSDEITLIWPAMNAEEDAESKAEEKERENNDENEESKSGKNKKQQKKNKHAKEKCHLFGGRAVKISSVLAGYCSTRFNYHMTQMSNSGVFSDENVYEKHVQQRIIGGEAHFDGRCFNVPNDGEVLNNIIWRCHFDCTRNSISGLARSYYSPKEMHGKGSKDLLKMLKEEKNVDWSTDTPLAFRYGTFVKRELYDVECVVKAKGGKESRTGLTKRTKITFTPIEMDKYEEKYIGLLLSKYWDQQWLDEYKSSVESVEKH